MSEPLGSDVWVKDETGNVGGSHKARHLVTTLLHLRAAEAPRPSLPTAPTAPRWRSPRAATPRSRPPRLAERVEWPLRVFVPEWADEAVVSILDRLGAEIVPCPRRDDDPPGDPAVLRFREAVTAGALPFSVQGPENALVSRRWPHVGLGAGRCARPRPSGC